MSPSAHDQARTPADSPSRDATREPKWRRYLRFHRADPVADLDDEFRDHLASAEESLVAGGMSANEARGEARRRFGDIAGVRRDVERLDARHERRGRRAEFFETLLQDVRYGARMLRRSPGFTFVAVLSIALAMAANSTVFSVVNAILLRPIPGADNHGLVRVYLNHHGALSWRELSWLRGNTSAFQHIVTERNGAMAFRAASDAPNERIRTSLVTRGFFPALRVPMVLGRDFDVDEASADAARPVAVLSHGFWQRRFGGDSGVIGRVVFVSGHAATVVGVATPDFRSSVVGWAPELFLPFASAPLLTGTPLDDFGGGMYSTARLRPGVSRSAGNTELGVLMRRLAATDTARYARTTLRTDHTRGVNAELRTPAAAASVFLIGMVAVVLLVACANVANLLMGRAAARQGEIGVRLAVGASRHRIVRQLLTESLLLAVAGTLIGIGAAIAITGTLARALPPEAGIDGAIFAPDFRVLGFTGALCFATTLLFGFVPALRASSPQLTGMLREAAPGGVSRRPRGRLLTAQASLCVLLLAVAAIFWRSLERMRDVDPGFRVAGMMNVPVDLSLVKGEEDVHQRSFAALLERVRGLPGVTGAALAAQVPLSGNSMETPAAPDGALGESGRIPSVHFNIVTPGYFETLGIGLREGRDFARTDDALAGRVVIVNETAAQRWWPGQAALGKRVRWGEADGPLLEVIGVVRDARYVTPGEEPRVFVYVPLAQSSRPDMTLHVHTRAGFTATRDALWSILHAELPALPPPPVTSLDSDMSVTLLPVRAGAALLGALGLVALLLAATGIYGVTAYTVARRTRELGIRAALGAGHTRLVRMVVRESLRPVTIGLAVGVLLSLLVAFGLSRVLYGVRLLDPAVLPLATLVLALVAVLAALAPAWRAASIDPLVAMRTE